MIQLKFVVFAIMVAAVASLMFGGSAVMEQVVKAQNMTATNMTDSAGNVSQPDGSGSISGLLKPPRCDLYPC
ncbi:MAG: hypothetical protein ACRD8Z_00895 [Nitrososphaeraceae archaeon]